MLSNVSTAQETKIINGSQFIQTDSGWYQIYSNSQFLVDKSVITVKWKSTTTAVARAAFNTSQNAIMIEENILGFVDLKINNTTNILDVVNNYINSGLVDIAEPNTYGTLESLQTNDLFFNNQWYLNDSNDYDINATEAWAITTGDSSIIVGIMDSGIDWLHEDLGMGTDGYQNIWLNQGEDAWTDPNDPKTGNEIDDDGNGFVDDWKGWNFKYDTNYTRDPYGHGSMVGGIVSAKSNNLKGISGIAGGSGSPGVKLLPITICGGWTDEHFYSTETRVTDDAILYAVAKGAKVINMSFICCKTTAIDSAIEYAYHHGCVLVAVAGNVIDKYYRQGRVGYPGNHPYVIAVAGTGKDGLWFASYAGPELDISAPAESIKSTSISTRYGTDFGTSYASPQVAGVAALMLSVNPTLLPFQIDSILKRTATDIGETGMDTVFGAGRLNAYSAVINAIPPEERKPILSMVDYCVPVSTSPTLNWYTRFGVLSYRLQVASDSNFSIIIKDSSGIKTRYCTLTGLANSSIHYWRVSGYVIDGNPIWSDSKWFRTSALPTVTLTGSTISGMEDGIKITHPKLIWTVSDYCNINYNLYRYTCYHDDEDCVPSDCGINGLLIYSGTQTSYIDSTVSTGSYNCITKHYYVRVKANTDGQLFPASNKVWYGTIWLDPNKQGLIADKEKNSLPKEATLYDNYPNPFNPQTTIKYTIPEPTYVRLVVYDILGRDVKLLVDSYEDAGYKSVTFDASDIPSGLYYYRLITDKFNCVKKLLLVK